MSFEAYSVYVKIQLVDGVSRGLLGLTGHFQRLNAQTNAAQRGLDQYGAKLLQLHRQLGNAKNFGLLGGAMAGVGFGMMGMLKGPLDEARKFQTEVAKFSALGFGDGVTSQAVKFAQGMNVMGQSARDNMKLLREAVSITGSLDHAEEIAPVLAKMKFGIESVMSKGGRGAGHGEQSERMFMDLIKTGELRGALKDMDKFKAVANLATQAYVASGGQVKPGDFLQMIKTGGTAAKTMNDQAFWFSSLHTMQEMGGSRTGTALMSAYQNLVMGRTTQQVAEELAKAGFIDQTMLRYGKTGHITKVLPGALTQAEAFKANPFHYMTEVIEPALRAKGLNDAQIQNELQKYASNRTALSLLDTMFRERSNIARSEAQASRAMGIDGLYRLGSGTYDGKELELRARWADAQREFGNTILPLAIRGLDKMNAALKTFTIFARENPGTIKALTGAFIGLGGALLFGGTVAGLASAFKGLQAVGTVASLAFGAAGGTSGLIGAIGALASPIGIAVAALGTLAAAAYALRPISQGEIDAVKDGGGVRLTAGAASRVKAFGIDGKGVAPLPGHLGSGTAINNTIVLPNGEVLARIVTQHQAKEWRRQPTGARAVDPTAALFPVSASLGY
ncbi:phage tail tape measure protein [Noviherbaspirillum pedocola]|uniref:Uncharacterized protein n=1 Tax=Noviherbaspirillum pedocola TaxID=2801341 RepID=A0A934WAJ9_9BURK|nr:hypothetical protein [Noviherbaspirillum pedocola]MBK4739209.1 hypothetical protein [Noviherbaspirillum pedocola]